MPLTGQPPLRIGPVRARAPRVAAVRARWSATVRRTTSGREPPSLDDALELEVDFGKFHGHTLGEIAAFEPSYVDWLAGTVTRDPALALAARVICRGAGPAGDPAGAPARAAGLAVEPVPLGATPGIETPPAISPEASMM